MFWPLWAQGVRISYLFSCTFDKLCSVCIIYEPEILYLSRCIPVEGFEPVCRHLDGKGNDGTKSEFSSARSWVHRSYHKSG